MVLEKHSGTGMTNYWREHFDSAAIQWPQELLKQVGKTVNGAQVDDAQVGKFCDAITCALQLKPADRIADLCCGNGIITRFMSEHCGSLVGVDFSKGLVDVARKHNSAPNLEYIVADVCELEHGFFDRFEKVYMYEAVQHLTTEQFVGLLGAIRDSQTVKWFFIGGIPDREQFDRFYDTEEKRAFEAERQRAGRPHIGKWWAREEMLQTVASMGLSGRIIDQPPGLYASHFRFDCLVGR